MHDRAPPPHDTKKEHACSPFWAPHGPASGGRRLPPARAVVRDFSRANAERALKNLPGSYKLWLHYLRERREQVRGRVPTDGAVVAVNVRFPSDLPPPATP